MDLTWLEKHFDCSTTSHEGPLVPFTIPRVLRAKLLQVPCVMHVGRLANIKSHSSRSSSKLRCPTPSKAHTESSKCLSRRTPVSSREGTDGWNTERTWDNCEFRSSNTILTKDYPILVLSATVWLERLGLPSLALIMAKTCH